jgi:protoporphyrinogen oxidase
MIIIAGAGVTGLWLAKKLGHLKPLVISQDVGGLLGQYEEGGFTFDYGGHVYSPLDERVRDIMKRAGAIAHERQAVYLSDDLRHIPYPVQDHADQIGLTTKRLSFSSPPTNLKEWGYAQFGFNFYEKWYQPFNARVWSIDPVEMDVDWVRNRVKIEPSEDPKEWGPNASFLYAPGKEIIKVMRAEAKAAGAKFLKATIHDVIIDRHILHLTETAKPDYYKYDQLYWTLPISALSPQVGFEYDSFRSNRVRTFGIGLRDVLTSSPFHWAYCNVDSICHRITWLSRYHPTMSPNGKDSLLVELPYRHVLASWIPRMHRKISSPNEVIHRSLAQRVLKEAGFGFIKESDIEVSMMGDAMGYPIPTVGIRDVVAEVKRRLLQYGVMTAGRWGSWGYFNLDHCFNDAEAAINIPTDGVIPYLRSLHYYGG